MEITFYEQPETPYAGEDQNLDYSFGTYLAAGQPPVGQGYWQFTAGTGTFEDSALYNTYVEFPELGLYELTWTVTNGVCTPVSSSIIIDINDLQIFTGFSPNDDEINDEFILKLSGRNEVELIIIDRWGKEVYRDSEVEEIIWDGTNKDGPLPEGTYFYIINEPNRKTRKGYIELRR